MSEWKECKLGNYATINMGQSPKSEYYNAEGIGLPFLQGNRTFGDRFPIIDTYCSNPNKTANENEILFSVRAPVGDINIANQKICIGRGLASLNSNTEDNIFLFYLLHFLKREILNSESGTVFGSINRTDLENIEILLPPLPEQRAIASVLSSLDDKIDLLHRQNQTLEAMAETLFRQWFVEEADEGWEVTTLEQHTEVFRGLSYKGSGLTENGLGMPMHNLNSVYEGGGYKITGIKFYRSEYKNRHLAYPGDIIVTNTEQGHEFKLIGFPAIVPDSFGNTGLFSQHIYKIVPKKQTDLSREFIYYLLMSTSVREQIISATNGSTVNMLAIDGLQRPEFKLPPKNKVIEFTAIISAYWKKNNINNKQIRTLEKLRDTLLPKLMSGEVKVKI